MICRAWIAVFLSVLSSGFIKAQDYLSGTVLSRGWHHLLHGFSAAADTTASIDGPMIIGRTRTDDYLNYRYHQTRFTARHFGYSLGYDQRICTRRSKPDRVLLEISDRQSRLRWQSGQKEKKYQSDKRLLQYRLRYERQLSGPFHIAVEVIRAEANHQTVWNGNVELGFDTPKWQWLWRYGTKPSPGMNRVDYGSDTIFAPTGMVLTIQEFTLQIKDVYRFSIEGGYRLHDDNHQQHIRRPWSSRIAGSYEMFYSGISYPIDRTRFYIFYRTESWKEKAHGYKNRLQYAKINLPNFSTQEWLAGNETTLNEQNYLKLLSRYYSGGNHLGMIVDGWPFTGALGALLGVKNYARLDGEYRLITLQPSYLRSFFRRHWIEPKLSVILFHLKGTYRYRKQDGFFQVIERGKFSIHANKKYIFPAVSYGYQHRWFFVFFQAGQLIPVDEGNTLKPGRETKVSGGFTFSVHTVFTYW